MTARTITDLKQGVPIGLLAAGGFASSSREPDSRPAAAAHGR
jgi:hypothetical protein